LADAWQQTVAEVRHFLRTAAAFTAHPGRFADEWLGGKKYLNPLGFLANSFAVTGVVDTLMQHVGVRESSSDTLLEQFLAWLLPFVYFLAIGIIEHGVLRAFGSRRSLSASCAMALYAGGGPSLAAQLVAGAVAAMLTALQLPTFARPEEAFTLRGMLLAFFALLSVGVYALSLAISLRHLHGAYGIRRWHVLAATVVAFLVTGLVLGTLHPPGNYGVHLELHLFPFHAGILG
jgi:hypothetical protein